MPGKSTLAALAHGTPCSRKNRLEFYLVPVLLKLPNLIIVSPAVQPSQASTALPHLD